MPIRYIIIYFGIKLNKMVIKRTKCFRYINVFQPSSDT